MLGQAVRDVAAELTVALGGVMPAAKTGLKRLCGPPLPARANIRSGGASPDIEPISIRRRPWHGFVGGCPPIYRLGHPVMAFRTPVRPVSRLRPSMPTMRPQRFGWIVREIAKIGEASVRRFDGTVSSARLQGLGRCWLVKHASSSLTGTSSPSLSRPERMRSPISPGHREAWACCTVGARSTASTWCRISCGDFTPACRPHAVNSKRPDASLSVRASRRLPDRFSAGRGIVDMLLHPENRAFRYGENQDCRRGVDFLRLERQPRLLRRRFLSGEMLERVLALPAAEQWAVVENLR